MAGFLLRDYRYLDLGDAIVAATCLSLNAKLATRNIKVFAWYDNEYGYSNRLIEQVIQIGNSAS